MAEGEEGAEWFNLAASPEEGYGLGQCRERRRNAMLQGGGKERDILESEGREGEGWGWG